MIYFNIGLNKVQVSCDCSVIFEFWALLFWHIVQSWSGPRFNPNNFKTCDDDNGKFRPAWIWNRSWCCDDSFWVTCQHAKAESEAGECFFRTLVPIQSKFASASWNSHWWRWWHGIRAGVANDCAGSPTLFRGLFTAPCWSGMPPTRTSCGFQLWFGIWLWPSPLRMSELGDSDPFSWQLGEVYYVFTAMHDVLATTSLLSQLREAQRGRVEDQMGGGTLLCGLLHAPGPSPDAKKVVVGLRTPSKSIILGSWIGESCRSNGHRGNGDVPPVCCRPESTWLNHSHQEAHHLHDQLSCLGSCFQADGLPLRPTPSAHWGIFQWGATEQILPDIPRWTLQTFSQSCWRNSKALSRSKLAECKIQANSPRAGFQRMTLASQQKVRVKMKPNIPGIPKVSEDLEKNQTAKIFLFFTFGSKCEDLRLTTW